MAIIATLSDWLKSFAPNYFSTKRSKTKTIHTLYTQFPHALNKLHVIATNSDWFIALFAPFVIIGQSNKFGIGFSTTI